MAAVEVFDNLDLAIKHVRNFEEATKSNFVIQKRHKKSFGNTEFDWRDNRNRVRWLDNGIPFFNVNRKTFECKHGPDRHSSHKEKQKKKKENEQIQDHLVSSKTREINQHTRKLGCPAQISLIEAITFPEYRVTNLTMHSKKRTSEELRRILNEKGESSVKSERKILVLLPAKDAHKYHPIEEAAGGHQLLDPRIKLRIQSLVADSSFTSVRDIKRSLEDFVKYELFSEPSELPDRTNRRFFPSDKVIQNVVYAARNKLSLSKNEQEALIQMLQKHSEENPFDYIFFRPATRIDEADVDDTQTNKLLLIFQSKEQKQLMNRYGNYVCLLDAIYRTTKYSLPLFFICVKTNVDYHVIAMFVLQDKKTSSIIEALQIISAENPEWQPKNFLTDFCDQEVKAVEHVFEGSFVFLCDFHREQVWVRWVRKSSNGIPKNRRNEVLDLLRKVADSETEEKFHECLDNLQSSDLWQGNKKLQNWLMKEWLPESKRWVWVYRKDKLELNVYTNDSLECQNECLKYKSLCNKKQRPLCSMMHTIITQFFPDQYKSYCELNITYSSWYRRYSNNVPSYLRDRPKSFVLHCMECLSEDIDPNHIQRINDCSTVMFSVQSQSDRKKKYKVSLGSQDDMPYCECRDWVKTKWLCKHFFAIFLNSDVTWNDLSSQYRESPYLNLDVTVPGLYVQDGSEESVNIVSNNEPVDHAAQEQPQLPEVCLPSASEDKISNLKLVAKRCRDLLSDIRTKTFEITDESLMEELEQELGRMNARLGRQMAEDGLYVVSSASASNRGKLSLSHKRKKVNNSESNCGASSMRITQKYGELPQTNKKKRVASSHRSPVADINTTSISCIESRDNSAVIEEGFVYIF